MLSVDVRSVKDCLIAPARRLDIEKHLRDLGMTLPIIKIGLVFVSGDLKHDTEGVINFNDIMDGWVDVNLDSVPSVTAATTAPQKRTAVAVPGLRIQRAPASTLRLLMGPPPNSRTRNSTVTRPVSSRAAAVDDSG